MAAQVGPECAILRPATIFAECQKATTFSFIIAAKERLSLGSPKSRARLTAIRRRKKATRGRSCSGEATTEASDACADQRKARAQGHRACSAPITSVRARRCKIDHSFPGCATLKQSVTKLSSMDISMNGRRRRVKLFSRNSLRNFTPKVKASSTISDTTRLSDELEPRAT